MGPQLSCILSSLSGTHRMACCFWTFLSALPFSVFPLWSLPICCSVFPLCTCVIFPFLSLSSLSRMSVPSLSVSPTHYHTPCLVSPHIWPLCQSLFSQLCFFLSLLCLHVLSFLYSLCTPLPVSYYICFCFAFLLSHPRPISVCFPILFFCISVSPFLNLSYSFYLFLSLPSVLLCPSNSLSSFCGCSGDYW